MGFNLFELYHPSGLPRQRSEDPKRLRDQCVCGCSVSEGGLSAEQLGFKDTPGLREIARLRAAERQAQPKPAVKSRPWKGAEVSTGRLVLPEEKPCHDPSCTREHIERYVGFIYSDKKLRHHPITYEARVYRLPSGAEIRVRADSKWKP